MKIVEAPHPSSGHYCGGVISHGMLYVSGQTSADPFTGEVTGEGIAAEMLVCLTRMEHILQAAGIDRNHVVMCRVYVSDMSMWKEANEAYKEFFGVHRPARAVYESPHIHHGSHLELEVVAEMEDSGC